MSVRSFHGASRQILIWLILIALAACTAQPATIPGNPVTGTETHAVVPSATLSATAQDPEKALTDRPAELALSKPENEPPTPTAVEMQASPTPDLRLDPDDWQSWPVVPERVSERLKEVYRQGLANQNNPRAFSKIGDCQNVPNAFLGVYDRPGQYWFDENFSFLEETIQVFQGSFQRESQAVRGGFNVASVLSPLWADRQHCLKGETPLECEVRLWQPSMVIISMETWFQGRSPETYDKYLRQIVEEALAHSAVPILATKADNTEGDHSINRVIAQVAYDYDLPLWNFWLAVQPLPDHGIDWERDSDGFHITLDAWNKRSFTALQALDSVWKLLNPVSSAQAVALEASPTPEPTPALDILPGRVTPYPTSRGTEQAGSGWFDNGQVIVSLGALVDGQRQASGVLLLELQGKQQAPAVVRLTGPGIRLEGLSSSREQMLLSEDDRLFAAALDGSVITLVSENFLPASGTSAAWISETPRQEQIAYLGSGPAIFLAGPEEATEQALTASPDQPHELVPTWSKDAVAWIEVTCTNTACGFGGLRWLPQGQNTANPAIPLWEEVQQAVFSTDGVRYAFTTPGKTAGHNLYLARLDSARPRLIRKTNGYFEHLSWSPDGKTLLAIETVQSKYSGRILERKYWLFNAERLTNTLLGVKSESATHATWSGDGGTILFLGMEEQDGQNSLRIQGLEVVRRRIVYDQVMTIPWEEVFMFLERVEGLN